MKDIGEIEQIDIKVYSEGTKAIFEIDCHNPQQTIFFVDMLSDLAKSMAKSTKDKRPEWMR